MKLLLISFGSILFGVLFMFFMSHQRNVLRKSPEWCLCRKYNLEGVATKLARSGIHSRKMCAPLREMIP